MSEFLNALRAKIKSKGYTQYSFSQKTGIERSYLNKMLNGERMIPVAQLELMLSVLNLHKIQEDPLREMYIRETVGDDALEAYRRFIAYVATVENRQERSAGIQISFDLSQRVVRADTIHDTLLMTECLLQKELEKEAGQRRFCTNLPSRYMRRICKRHPCREELNAWDFRYLVNMEEEHGQIDFLSCMVELLLLGYESHYNRESLSCVAGGGLFVHVTVTSDCILLTDARCENGFLLQDREAADIVAERFDTVYRHTKSVAQLQTEITNFANQYACILKYDNDTHFSSIENHCCVTLFMTPEMWNEIAKPGIPERDGLIKFACDYGTNLQANVTRKNLLYSRQSVERFAETGLLRNMPQEFIRPLSVKNRIAILEKMRDLAKTSGNSLCLFDENPEMNGTPVSIDVMSGRDGGEVLMIGLNAENMPLHYLGNLTVFIYEPETVRGIRDYINCMAASPNCMRREETARCIQNLINKLGGSEKTPEEN